MDITTATAAIVVTNILSIALAIILLQAHTDGRLERTEALVEELNEQLSKVEMRSRGDRQSAPTQQPPVMVIAAPVETIPVQATPEIEVDPWWRG